MSDFDMHYAGICSRKAAAADDTAKLLYSIRQITAISETVLDSTADELKEARDRGRQCQIGRDELERENQALRARLDRIDQDNADIINMLTIALNSIPEEVDQVLDIPNARDHISRVMKILNPPTNHAPF